MDKLWKFLEGFFADIKCELFYHKERKIQICLKNNNPHQQSRKRRASSESSNSESATPVSTPAPVSPSKKLKLKKLKRDLSSSSSVGDKNVLKVITKPTQNIENQSKVSPGVSPAPATQPQLSPTKSGGKKVPIYHNAHKIFRAQQIARQINGSVTNTPLTTGAQVSRSQASIKQSRSLADASKLSQQRSQEASPSSPPALIVRNTLTSSSDPPHHSQPHQSSQGNKYSVSHKN